MAEVEASSTRGPARAWRPFARRPLVIAHRGASVRALENTVPAFELARAEGADAVELDVQRTLDGQVVVFHDDDLERLAGRNVEIAELPLAEVRELRLRGRMGEGVIPTLDEALEAIGKLCVNIELKAPRARDGQRLAHAVAGLLERHTLGGRALVSSFNPFALVGFRLWAPHVRTAMLCAHEQPAALREAWAQVVIRPFGLHPESRLVHRMRMERWRAAGRMVNAWTVDDPVEARRLMDLGIDGIITNQPREMRALVDRL